MLPAFLGGLPGGMELAVIFLILVTFAIVAVVVVAIGRTAFGGRDRGRVDELESRVSNLEGQVDALREELQRRDE